jgi:dTDP-4-amino-4,6-dideoxygalactose transaminase
MNRIDVFKPTCGDAELAQVADSFNTGWLGKGRKVAAFEAAWAAHIGVDPAHVVSVSCATEGLFQVCELMGLSASDEVIIPSIHFIGANNAIAHTGATPVYCDVDPYSLNPDLECIVFAYRPRKTKAVMLLHYGGVAQELDDIRAWCNERDLWLIEDAACAQATTYAGKAAGTWGQFGVWSFDAMKVMTTGDGGMIYCEDRFDADRLRSRVYLGMDTESGLSSDHDRWWEYKSYEPSRRAIMNDVAAGIGLEQLKKLSSFIYRRIDIVRQYDAELVNVVKVPPTGLLPYYFYWIQTDRRDELARHLRDNGIYCTFRYYPLHRVFKTGQTLPGVDYAADHTLLLPLHQGLTDDDVQFVIDKVKEFYR